MKKLKYQIWMMKNILLYLKVQILKFKVYTFDIKYHGV